VTRFVPAVYVIIGWLGVRSLVLAASGLLARRSLRAWTLLSAATDFVLALIVLIGLSAATFAVALFGPTPLVISSFAWVLALSFVVTGTYLLEVASTERES
jgi:hypothetical protein